MRSETFYREIIGEPAQLRAKLRSAYDARMIARHRARTFLQIMGVLAIPVSNYADDPHAACEHGYECERAARAWTIEQGSGYVVACSGHAQTLLNEAVRNGSIERRKE